MSKIKKNKIISISVLIFWMVIIFLFSAQKSGSSSNLSSGIVNRIIEIGKYIFPDINISKNNLGIIVRKGAHFSEYFILGILVKIFLENFEINDFVVAFLLCIIYACTDEFHQLFVSGRSGQILDVFIDSLGSLTGIIFFYIYKYFKNYSNKKKLD